MTGYTVHTGSTEKFSQAGTRFQKTGAKKSPSKAKTPREKETAAAGSRTKAEDGKDEDHATTTPFWSCRTNC